MLSSTNYYLRPVKNILIGLLLLVFTPYLSAKITITNQTGDGDIRASIASVDNKISFSVINLPKLPSKTYQTPFRSYFWLFGDGQYSFEANPTHIFEDLQDGKYDFNVLLRTTRIKSDDDIEESSITLTIECTSGSCNAALKNRLPTTEGKSLRMDVNRSPKAGDSITYIVTYRNTCPEEAGGVLSFTYEPKYFSSYNIRVYHDEDPKNSINGALQMNFRHNPLSINEQRNVFITLTLKPKIKVNRPIICRSSLNFDEEECANNQREILKRGIVRSHDPNHKDVDQALMCPNSSLPYDSCTGDTLGRKLTYTIRFQNIGDTAAHKIRISDVLHPYLKWNTLNRIVTIHPNALDLNDSRLFANANGEVEFVFNNIGLKGTNQAGYGIDFREVDTWGEVTYTITAKNSLPPCASIINQATIIFDCNAPISTDTATTFIQNSKCCACQDTCQDFALVQDTISTIVLSDGSIGTMLPVSEAASCLPDDGFTPEYYWYPATDLDNPTWPSPTARPTDTTTYTLTVFKQFAGLRGPISQVTVFPSQPCQIAAPIISSPSTITTSDPTTITLTVSNPMSACYQWYKNGILMEHKNNSSLQLTECGSYRVEYEEEGCSVLSNTVKVVCPVNIGETPPFTVQVQSNITQNEVNVHIHAPTFLETTIAAFNLQGQLLVKNTLTVPQTASKTLDLGTYPSGMYIVAVSDGRHTISQKIFKH